MADNILEIRHLSKSFGTHEVLRDIDFDVKKGDVISIIGASGSGKSTMMRCVNLLETPTSGDILYHGENVTGKSVNAAKYRSHVGMVFQSFNLFNNMTVLKNCMVGQMKVLGRSKAEAEKQAMQYLEKVGTSRAKAISCVTTSMVMPSCARSCMTESTSPTISGTGFPRSDLWRPAAPADKGFLGTLPQHLIIQKPIFYETIQKRTAPTVCCADHR